MSADSFEQLLERAVEESNAQANKMIIQWCDDKSCQTSEFKKRLDRAVAEADALLAFQATIKQAKKQHKEQ